MFPLVLLLAYGERVCLRGPATVGATPATSWALSVGSPNQAFYQMPSRLWELASGALLYELQSLHPFQQLMARPAVLASFEGLTLALLGSALVLTNPREGRFPFPWALLPVLGALSFMAAGTVPRRPVRLRLGGGCTLTVPTPLLNSALSMPPVVYLGKISYPLYLWHWPIITAFRWGLLAAVCCHALASCRIECAEPPSA